MVTSDLLLAAFIRSLHVEVRKLDNGDDMDTYEFALEETDPIVVQFTAPDGYNANIKRVANAVVEIEAQEYYVAPEPEPAE